MPSGHFLYKHIKNQHKDRHNYKEAKVKGRKKAYIASGFSGIVLSIFPEGYKTCKRRYKRTDAANIHSNKKVSIISCKL